MRNATSERRAGRRGPAGPLGRGALLGGLLWAAACGGDGGEPGSAADMTAASEPAGMEAMPGPAGAPGQGEMPGMESTQGMAGADARGGAVRLEPGQAERIGLRWGEVAVEPLSRTIRAAATVEYPESEMVWVSSRVSGWVERLHVRFEGASVRRGDPVLEIYSPDLVSAQEELLLARRLEGDLAAAGVGRAGDSLVALARRRLAYWDISDDQIARLLETGAVQKTLTLHAPATGVVMRKQVFEGQGIRAGENLLMLAATDPVWIEAAVQERDLPFVRTGLPAGVTVEGLPGETLEGRVSFLFPALRAETRTLIARIEVPNPEGRLKPGMYATVGIERRTEPLLSVPASALLHTGTRAIAFMDMGGGRLMPMTVRTGREGDERVEILAGLSAGDRVALSAQFLLDSESNLMEAMQAMMAQMGRTGGEGMDGMEGMDMEGAEPGEEGMDMDSGAAPAPPDSAGSRRGP